MHCFIFTKLKKYFDITTVIRQPMRNNKILFSVLIYCVTSFGLHSQINETRNYNLTTSSNNVGIGSCNILDPYLSPYEYRGSSLNYFTDYQRFVFRNDSSISSKHELDIQLGSAKHPTRINSMMFANGSYDLAIYYRLKPIKNLTLQLGGSWSADLGGKYISRNVNNPFSLDLYTDVNFSLSANYKFNVNVFNWFSQSFRIEYGAKTPFAGCMFVPEQGASYYEIFSLKNLTDAFHFSSFHNKRNITQYFNLDVPVSFTTFRIGFRNELLQYKANDMVFHRNTFSVQLGWVTDLYVFQGTKNKPPKNFKSTY